MPFTREWCVTRFFDSFDESDIPFERVRLTVLVDSDSQALLEACEARALQTRCAEVVVHFTAWAPPEEFAKSRERRGRHSAMRTASVGLIPDADYLLLLEDDTLIPANSWERLSAGLAEGYDWVSGFEVGRWNCPCPGIWDMSTEGIRKSATPGDGLEPCDATGVYLVLTTPETYRSQKWDVWDNAYGHDVSITWLMSKAGKRLGVDWSLRCIHMTQKGDLTCDMWGPSQNRNPLPPFSPKACNTVPLTSFPKQGPERGEFQDTERVERQYRLGCDIIHDGRHYPKGTKVGHGLAVQMSEAGSIKARIT